ncbi:hypothetical protein DFH09DRAFT_1087444 [Mycena vulgaris]|nr:hypothetical protein DFH09DRAFT_1087444 [Mycena vulgaris]
MALFQTEDECFYLSLSDSAMPASGNCEASESSSHSLVINPLTSYPSHQSRFVSAAGQFRPAMSPPYVYSPLQHAPNLFPTHPAHYLWLARRRGIPRRLSQLLQHSHFLNTQATAPTVPAGAARAAHSRLQRTGYPLRASNPRQLDNRFTDVRISYFFNDFGERRRGVVDSYRYSAFVARGNMISEGCMRKYVRRRCVKMGDGVHSQGQRKEDVREGAPTRVEGGMPLRMGRGVAATERGRGMRDEGTAAQVGKGDDRRDGKQRGQTQGRIREIWRAREDLSVRVRSESQQTEDARLGSERVGRPRDRQGRMRAAVEMGRRMRRKGSGATTKVRGKAGCTRGRRRGTPRHTRDGLGMGMGMSLVVGRRGRGNGCVRGRIGREDGRTETNGNGDEGRAQGRMHDRMQGECAASGGDEGRQGRRKRRGHPEERGGVWKGGVAAMRMRDDDGKAPARAAVVAHARRHRLRARALRPTPAHVALAAPAGGQRGMGWGCSGAAWRARPQPEVERARAAVELVLMG